MILRVMGMRKKLSKEVRGKIKTIKSEVRYRLTRLRLWMCLKQAGVGNDTWFFLCPAQLVM